MKTIHIIAGPTASGKSALALERAIATNGAIVNVDSRQIYAALPILTAQPSEADLKTAPHHLYGVLDPNDSCSAGRWCEMALPLIEKLLADGITPIVTGGTGLYIKALIEGLSPIPLIPPDIRAAANALQKQLGNPQFYAELQKRDPLTAALYHPNHTARLIHAWEVLEATGKPLAEWQAMPKRKPPQDWQFDITLVMPPRDILYARCNARFEQMLESGAMEELEAFDAQVASGTIRPDAIPVKTIGAEALRRYRSADITKAEAITFAQAETRHYAKRQTTWFNNQIKKTEHMIINFLK